MGLGFGSGVALETFSVSLGDVSVCTELVNEGNSVCSFLVSTGSGAGLGFGTEVALETLSVAVEVVSANVTADSKTRGSMPSLNLLHSGQEPSPMHSAKLAFSPLQPSRIRMVSRPSANDALQYLLRRILTALPCQPPW